MRIPSNFNDRSLYRDRRALRRESSQSMRRVVRLVLALGVVLVVMRQAGDPSVYRPFFPASPNALTTPVPPSSAPARWQAGEPDASSQGGRPLAPGVGDASDSQAGGSQDWAKQRSTERERRLVAGLDAEGQQRLTRWLAHWRRTGAQAAAGGRDASLVTNTESIGTESPAIDAQASIAALMAAIESQVPRFDSPEAAALLQAVEPLTLVRLQDALDQTYQARVIDGTIWRGADADAFYRGLEKATQEDFAAAFLASDPPPRRVGVVPLMQQPTQYLGHAVWLYGSVARAVPVPAKENPFGIDKYWEVWLRPDDGTERAVILYAPDVPMDISAIGPDATLQQGPSVAIAGTFLKRRLFGAVGGATESPVIVGRIWERAPQLATAAGEPLDPRQFWSIVAIAGVIGLSIAGILLWRSAVTARQLRRVRSPAAVLPDTFSEIVSRQSVADDHSHPE